MGKRLITVCRCPLCGDEVVTKTGFKQYIHTSCWYDMIKEKRPYNGKLYL
jgi:ribosomal protein S27E